MSVADDIINKKKKKRNIADEIINKTYSSNQQTTQIAPTTQTIQQASPKTLQLTGNQLLDSAFKKISAQDPTIQLIAPVQQKKSNDFFSNILNTVNPINVSKNILNKGIQFGSGAVKATGEAWNNYLDYAASGKLEKDIKNLPKNVMSEASDWVNIYNKLKTGNVKEALFTGQQGKTLWDKMLPVSEGLNIAGKTVIGGGIDAFKSLYNTAAVPTEELLRATGITSEEQYQARKEKRQAFMAEDGANALWEGLFGWDQKTKDYVKKNSFITEENGWGRVVQGLTYSLEMAALGETALGWEVPTFLSASGQGQRTEYVKGADDLEALVVGTLGGLVEVGAEKMFGGVFKMPGTGKFKSVEALENELTNSIKSNVGRYAAQYGFNILNENLEEVAGGLANSIIQRLVYMDKPEMQDLYSSQEAMEDFIYTTITTTLSGGARVATNGGIQQVREDIKSGRSQITGYTQNEQKVLDAVTEQRLQEQEKEDKRKLTRKEKNAIIEQVQEDFRKGYIDTNEIENSLGFDAQQIITNAENMMGRQMTDEEKVNEYLNARNKFYEGLQNDSYLMESVAEEGRRSEKFDVDLKQYSGEQRRIVENIVKSGVLNNTNATHEMVDWVSKIAADKGIDFNFTNNENIKGSRFAVKDRTVNGYVDGNTIRINVDSNQAVHKTVGHEITHVLEGTELYNQLQDSLKAYVGQKQWADLKKKYEKMYESVKNPNIDAEITADLVGEHLFNDKTYINNLSTENRNLFEKIYDEIKYMYKVATAGSKEKRQLEKVKKLFDEAYRTNVKKTTKDIKYQIENSVKNALKNKDSNNVLEISVVNEKTSNKIKELTGIDVSNRIQVLYDNDIRHMLNQHGNQKIEAAKGQIAITPEDLLSIPDVLENYDEITSGSDNREGKTVRYIKNYNNNKTVVVEVVPKKSSLKIKTMWKFTLDNSNNAPILTAKPKVNSTLNNDNISQNDKNVKYSLNEDNYTEEQLDNINKQIPRYVGMTKDQLNREYGYISDSYQEMVKLSNDLQKEYKEYQKTDEFMNALQNYEFDSEAWLKGDEYADKIRYYNREADKYFAQREAINSLLMDSETDTRSAIQIVKEAEKHFGTTNNVKEAGYIDLNGKMLDFSGQHEGGTKGNRNMDHLEIGEIDIDRDSFIGIGNIRIKPENGGINLEVEPNAKQYSTLRDFIEYAKQNNDEIYVDVVTPNGSYDSIRYNTNTQASKIINDIKSYFENGSFPQQSQYADFLQYSLSQDNQGRELSERQQEYFKDSKVRDENGNLLVMYNGRYSDDTVFKPSRWTNEKNGPTQIKGYFATDSSYSEIYGDVSEYYLNIKNPLYMGLENGNEALTLNEWQQFFKEHGITGVEFDSSLYGTNTKGNNAPDVDGQKRYLPFEIVDSDEYWNNDGNVTERIKAAGYDGLTWTEGGQAYMPFESNQIKRTDNLNPTESDDIRYSISKQDSNGRKLSEQQLEYFKDSKVRDSEGRLLEVYHGTPNPGFTVFDTNKSSSNTSSGEYGLYFTDSQKFADDFSYERLESGSMFYDIKGKKGDVYKVYLNMTNPLDFSKLTEADFANLYDNYISSMAKQITTKEQYIDNMTKWQQEYGNHQMMKGYVDLKKLANSSEYDGVIARLDTFANNDDSLEYIAFNSNQVKNVDNLNPTTNEDIRYSLSESGQTTDSNGKELSKGQLEYFKDSKMLNSNGNLEVVYHTTPAQFTIFDKNKIGENTEYDNTVFGFFITPTKDFSTRFGDINNENKKSNTMELYANIKKPITHPYNASYKYSGKELDNVVETYFKAINEKEGLEELKSYVRDGDYDNLYEAYMNAIVTDLGSPFEYASDEKKILQRKGYDAVEFVEGLESNTIEGSTSDKSVSSYAVFNSNQLKNTDNLNPTTNDDIRYSLSNDIAPTPEDLPFDVTFDEIQEALNLPKDVDRTEYLKVSDANKTTGQEYENQYSPFEKAKRDLAQKKLENFIEKETYKAIDKATNVAARYGEFNKKQKKSLRSDLTRFANMNAEQLTNADTYNELKDIITQYADREMNFVDEHLKEVKSDIRKRKFNVSDIKNQITDYNDFRRAYFGKLNLTDTGSSIDSQYQELSELYPEYFSPDVITEADMLDTLADFMDTDTTITEKYRLSDEEIDRITSKAFSTLVTEAPTEQQIQEFEAEVDRAVERKRSEVRRQQLLDEMGVTIDDIAAGKDINALGYQRTDPIRLNEKVFGYEVGNKINDATIRRTIHNTAEKMRWQNKERNEIEQLGIKARSKESAAVQKYGEGEYVTDLGEVVKYGDKELAAEFPDVSTQNKIKKAAKVLRGKYDTYIDQINEVITDLGYDAIPKRQNYFRHFMEINDKLSEWGIPFNRQAMNQDSLPTDINGLTDQFKPGKNYFASALERKGIRTNYDAITGIDGYIESAGNLIFHTADIQRYRALAKLIRETYGQQHGLDNIDIMTEAEKNQRVEDVYGNKLSKYAAWLDEQANALAGKKAAIDRAVERIFGRKVYTAANTLKQQVGSNMTGFNVRSAMTNFASVVQGMSKTNKIALLKGTISTLNNMIHDDGMTEKSDFLMGRYGTDQLSKKAWQKLANAGQIFMEATDHFTSNQIWRSKYFENLSKGMTEEQAIRNADDFAARVMGNRVQGATAEIFNSKTLGFLTQFQLEVNNQWSNIVHDNKMDLQSGTKTAASVVFQLGQLAAFSYIFNGIMKGLTGSDVMPDPIALLKKLFAPDDDDKDKTMEERAREVLGDIVNQLPMASIFTGGRIPIQEAFKGATTGFKYLTGQTNEYGQKYTASDVFDDSLESLAYLFMPTGYGQLRKTYKGTVDLDYDVNLNPFEGNIGITKRPVRGSYTDSGNLRFTADNSIPGRIKSALFGAYANPEAQSYIKSGYKTIDKSKIEELQQLEMTSSEYKRWKKEFDEATSTTIDIDGVKYEKYIDEYGDMYFYDKNSKTLLDSNLNPSYKKITELEKVSQNDLIYNYINSSDFDYDKKEYLFGSNFTNSTTDKYGYEKYTERVPNSKGVMKTYTYWYDPDTKTLYDSKYNIVDSSKLKDLTKVQSEKEMNTNFDSYEEFDYQYKNPEKYDFLKQNNISYKEYKNNETVKEAVDWAYSTPVNYSMSKAMGGDIVSYKEYMDTINDIKADKDSNGKSISGSRKQKVFNYVNSLKNLNAVQKAMLIRTQYSSYDDYGYEIINYLNRQTNITLEEQYEILEKLGYKVNKQTGIASW